MRARATGSLGILGGMFNPPHVGHLQLARAASARLGLERVVLMPVSIPPHKPAIWDPGAEHRVQMCRLACAHEPLVDVCALELERPGPSYTVDTLRSIHESDPGAELTLILGADTAATLVSWREPAAIASLARFAVAEREGTTREQVLSALAPLAGAERVDFVEMPPCAVSSSLVRRTITSGRPIEPMVGADVAAYIEGHELYGRQPAGHAGVGS